jgi:hypothetical protein
LAAKTPIYRCLILLDFFGFSRPNIDFSMGYDGFSGKNFSPPFSAGGKRRKGASGRGYAAVGDCSWRKLNLVSDFLQEIVA